MFVTDKLTYLRFMRSKKIHLISGPRNISTALMYSFAQRSDCKVLDEPLYAHFLANTGARYYHPGAQEVLDKMENDGEKVIEQMLAFDEKPLAFFKNMAHHFVRVDESFVKGCTNLFLIRNPKDVITSIAKVLENPTLDDIGLAKQVEILKYLNSCGLAPVIMDSNDFLQNPEKNMEILCDALNIDFDPAMLSWSEGGIPEDGIWAKYWYKNVHRSTGFGQFTRTETEFPERFKGLLDEAMPLFDDLSLLKLNLG